MTTTTKAVMRLRWAWNWSANADVDESLSYMTPDRHTSTAQNSSTCRWWGQEEWTQRGYSKHAAQRKEEGCCEGVQGVGGPEVSNTPPVHGYTLARVRARDSGVPSPRC
jgi:hypothetical protein